MPRLSFEVRARAIGMHLEGMTFIAVAVLLFCAISTVGGLWQTFNTSEMATASSSFYKGSDDLDMTCDVCQHQNKTSIAVSYCETCEEALCQTCDNVHRNQKLTRTHSLLTGEHVIDVKLAKQFREFGNVQDTSHVDDIVPGRKQGTSGPSGSVAGHTTGTSESSAGSVTGTSSDCVPGPVNCSDRDTGTVPSVLDMTVSDIKHHDVGCSSVMSVVFMPSGHVVLACSNDGLKLLDKHFKHLSQLSLYSVCACKVSDTEVLVSQGGKNQIRFVEVLPKMVAKNVLTIGKESSGVCYHNGEIYVACHNNLCHGEVRVVKMDGTVVRRLGVLGGNYMFTEPWDVKVNDAGDKVFVTDWGTAFVTCMNKSGRLLYRYTDTDLMHPAGMLVDRQDNGLVTGHDSYNVHVINKKGRRHKIVLTERDRLRAPYCISYRPDDGLLAIGLFNYCDTKSLMTVKTLLA